MTWDQGKPTRYIVWLTVEYAAPYNGTDAIIEERIITVPEGKRYMSIEELWDKEGRWIS